MRNPPQAEIANSNKRTHNALGIFGMIMHYSRCTVTSSRKKLHCIKLDSLSLVACQQQITKAYQYRHCRLHVCDTANIGYMLYMILCSLVSKEFNNLPKNRHIRRVRVTL